MDKEILEAARAVAFRFLGYTARSRAEIERRLERAEFAPDVIAAVTAEMAAAGWLDDERFARDWVGDRADRKMYGRGRLAAELRRRGVDKETVAEALEPLDEESESRRAHAALKDRLRPELLAEADAETRQAEKRKLAGFLQRRGFSWQIITQVLDEAMKNRG